MTITAKLLGSGRVELGTIDLAEVTPRVWQTYKDEETGKLVDDLYQYQSASRPEAPVYIYQWTQLHDSRTRIRMNPDNLEEPEHDPGDYDGGFGEGSYFQRAMQKDD